MTIVPTQFSPITIEGVRGVLYSPRAMDTQMDTWSQERASRLREIRSRHPVVRPICVMMFRSHSAGG
jgi:hypothetical protein